MVVALYAKEVRVPVYLNEAQAGCDQELLGFPHLLICLGVVVQTGAWLYGYHFDRPSGTQQNAVAFADFIKTRGGGINNAVHLYGVCNWSSRYDNGKDDWRAEMQAIAGVLGYHGKASGFDTSIIDPRHGTYVEFMPEYPQERCRIYYKRNEKMVFSNAKIDILPTRTIASYTADFNTGAMRPQPGQIAYTADAAVKATSSNKGELHELNYFLRLVTTTV